MCAAKVYVQVGASSTYFTLRDTAVVRLEVKNYLSFVHKLFIAIIAISEEDCAY